MSLGWKKFSFFDKEERTDADIPENAECSTSGGGHLLFGCSDGQVIALDRELKPALTFTAHPQAVNRITYLQQHKLLVTLGGEDATSGSATIKFWNLAAEWPGAPPPCTRTLRLFAPKATPPDARVTALVVAQQQWPSLTIAAGLSNGSIHVLQVEAGKEKISRSMLATAAEGDAASPVTGLGFHGEAANLSLFAVTKAQTMVFHIATGTKAVLDEMGAEAGCSVINQDGDLVVGRPEAVYIYTPDGRGPCFVFEGRKQHLAWLRFYLVAVSSGMRSSSVGGGPASSSGSGSWVVQVYDLRNKLVAFSAELGEGAEHVLCEWGRVLVACHGGRVLSLKERPLSHKLELLFAKNLYVVALNLAHSEQAEASVVAEVHRRYGDHLYGKHDYEGAVGQYTATIGQLEPSYVIRRFLDAQRIHNLTSYLEHLHAKELASSDHTTLLLNCYTKLKDVEKLDGFLNTQGAQDEQPHFDVETAVKACRAAGYYEQALRVAQRAGEQDWILDILLDDCADYDGALRYLQQDLTRPQAAAALTTCGKVLVTHRPEATTALLMQLCTPGDPATPHADWLAKVSDFAHIYADRPMALMLLCEYILNSARDPPGQEFLYHTLLELYLSAELDDEVGGAGQQAPDAAAAASSRAVRREQALELLKRGWPPGQEAVYRVDHVLVIARMRHFKPGLIFLYQTMRLFREVLRVHMTDHDDEGLIEAALRLGDAGQGGDPHLWNEVLEYFGSQPTDCTPQVRQVLAHLEAAQLLPPLMLLQALAKNPALKLSVVKDYIARQLQADSAAIEEDRRQIAKFQAEVTQMRAEVQELQTKARVFQNSKCALSGSPLELPAVHFLCGHSFNLRSLGENERECPLCAPGFRTILDIRRSMRAGTAEQDKFFTHLKNSADGFNVVADFFGRGILNSTSVATRGAA